MTVVLIAVIVILAVAVTAPGRRQGLRDRIRRPAPVRATSARRILFPFVAGALSQRALDAALRLAAAEGATLVPVFLARVSLDLPLESPLPRQCSMAMPLLEADRAARHRGGDPRGRPDRAGTQPPSRASPGDRGRELRPDRDRGRRARGVTGSIPTMSPGCSTTLPARSWSCGQATRTSPGVRPRRPGSQGAPPVRPSRARRGAAPRQS